MNTRLSPNLRVVEGKIEVSLVRRGERSSEKGVRWFRRLLDVELDVVRGEPGKEERERVSESVQEVEVREKDG